MSTSVVRRVGLALLGPVAAIAVALAISAVVLAISGHDPWSTYTTMAEYGSRLQSIISILNRSVPFYFSALAVALGFKMGLFNIGVEGQYRLAAVVAAAAGAAVTLPAPLHVLFIVIVAMAVGGAWGAIPGVLKVTRGVNEVISTIMLNAISTGVAAYLLAAHFKQQNAPGDLIIKTKEIPKSGWFPSLNPVLEAVGIDIPSGSELQGFLVIAALAGALFYFLVWRTRFGFDLRASGINPLAAKASGVNPNRMIITTMALSGAIAGLVGMSTLLGFFHRYTVDFPTGLGFTGIAIALLGRNHPAGIAFGAFLFAFLDRSAQVLDLEGIPKEIVVIMQGTIILSIVVAYEVVHRLRETQERKDVAAATEGPGSPLTTEGAAV
ncbi:MAG TPA: ABC transporter permease [Acidimicrobiales bacterium]|nr:ABC transporter permease [Acidimicrobiales bacterium]